MDDPSCLHLKATKRILRYVHGIVDFCIHYFSTNNVKLGGFSDSDWGSNLYEWNSTSENYFSLGTSLITWIFKKQTTIALYFIEAKYIALTSAGVQALWLQNVLSEIDEN